jgi:peptidoglycan L-alanyl-D-glutamate endopeptidase CwlK
MATYGVKSQALLNTTVLDLQVLFQEVVKEFDNTIIYGNRSQADQFLLWQIGRTLINGVWVVTDSSKVVTYKDGWNKMSMHNFSPSQAVDAVPYPVNWKDKDRILYFAGYVMGIATRLFEEGKITHKIRWGGDWDGDFQTMDETFSDLCHFEIVI